MMKSILRTISYALPFLFAITACQTVEFMSIDYLQPAEVSFPKELKSVAIVNNMPLNQEGRGYKIEDYAENQNPFIISRESKMFFGMPERAIETMAQSIADKNYFEEVVICDSALCQTGNDGTHAVPLTKDDVERLTQELSVDFLISLENLQLRMERTTRYISEGIYATRDVKVYPVFKVYVPHRSSPILHATMSDSIFWESLGYTPAMAEHGLISEKEAILQASDFAGTLPVRRLLPSWRTGSRILTSGGSADMRDASYMARQGQWDEAVTVWKRAYENTSKNKSKKTLIALNLALGYEMQDSISTAYEWATKACSLAPENSTYYGFCKQYADELKIRMNDLVKLKLQTER